MRTTWKLNVDEFSKSCHALGNLGIRSTGIWFCRQEYYMNVLLKSGRINMESIFESTIRMRYLSPVLMFVLQRRPRATVGRAGDEDQIKTA